MESIISAKNLNVGYDGKAVISGVNIEGIKGQIICLLGPNGAGKSTVLRTLSGLLAPIDGAVEIQGVNIKNVKQRDIAKKLSLVLTDSVSPVLTTVKELVSMGRTPYTGFMGRLTDHDRQIISEALETAGASRLVDRYYSQLSDGEKQKVMIARALVQEPELIILDEPTSHLDIKHKIEVIRVLQRLVEEKNITVILSLHDIDLALKGCQKILLVNGGKVVAQGTPEEVLQMESIQKLYDISGAKYNQLMGSVELQGKNSNDIFVTGGNASGINIYRMLSRSGYGITAGVLHRSDTDFQVAETICSKVITEKPFEPVSHENAHKALELAKASQCVIDTGFPVGSGNMENLLLLKRAVSDGIPVCSVRDRESIIKLLGNVSEKIIKCQGTGNLLATIEKIIKK